MKHMLSFISFLIVVSTLLTSCGSSEAAPTSDGIVSDAVTAEAGPDTAAETDGKDARLALSDDLPETDFEGKAYRISAMESRQYEAYSETENGDVCNDAVYNRNRVVEERFNVTFSPSLIKDTDYVSSITKTILAADDLYDVSTMNTYLANGLITQGLYRNWIGVPYVDFEQPWWNTKAIRSYTVGGKCYVVIGSFNLTMLLRTYAIFFNKELAEDYGLGDLYETVSSGQWTLDELDKLTSDLYSDLDGDGTSGEGDLFGFTADTTTCLDCFLPATDTPFFKNADGYPALCMDLEKASGVFEKAYKLYNENTGSFVSSDTAKLIDKFTGGSSVFYISWMDNAFKTFRYMDVDYGILPFVKYDEAQERYQTTSMDNVSAMTIPNTASDLELIGIVTEALYAESYKTVMPAYYEVALKTKFARDEQSAEMLDILMDGVTYDFAFLHYQVLDGVTQSFRSLIGRGSDAFASYFAKNETSLQNKLSSLIEIYKGLE